MTGSRLALRHRAWARPHQHPQGGNGKAALRASTSGKFACAPGRLARPRSDAGHREATQRYARPYETLARYVAVLQAGGVPRGSLVLAALGPRVLGLARDRAAGAIPISSRALAQALGLS